MRAAGGLRLAALALGIPLAAAGEAACLAIAAHPGDRALANVALAGGEGAFSVTYVHSVTRTPVVERYRLEGAVIVQESIAFAEHGPGMPTQSDASGAFQQRDGRMVMTMARRFERIVMRVHADQSPVLHAAGRDHDLAAWGNRSIALAAGPGCES